jgi:hypothetical protein
MKNVLVLGRGRCGTSMVAGVLDRLGVDMKTGVRDKKRVKGYYEGGEFIAQLREFAKKNEPFAQGNPPKEFIEMFEKYRKRGDWGSKTKATLTLLPWIEQLSEVYVIVLSRDKVAQAKSLIKNCWGNRQDWRKDPTYIYQSILRFHDKIEEIFKLRPNIPRLDLDFDYIIDNPVEATKKIAEFVEKPYNKDASDFIDRNMRHYGKN